MAKRDMTFLNDALDVRVIIQRRQEFRLACVVFLI